MAPGSIKGVTLGFTLALIAASESGAWVLVQTTGFEPLYAIGLVRLIQIGGLLAGVIYLQHGLAAIGWSPSTWRKGVVTGVWWAIAFGLGVLAVMGILYTLGTNPLRMVRTALPSDPLRLLFFFIIGGLIAPLAEEICFRGILYNYFRRWGIVAALLASTLIFVVLHSVHGFPLTQLVGGILFALSYEFSGNLMVPITLHAAGNLAIFTLSLF
jgi:hypothetical protein